MAVYQLPTFTTWANGGTMPTGLDVFGTWLDTDGATAWCFQCFGAGFARVKLDTMTILFQGNIFNTPGGFNDPSAVFLDSRYDGTPMWLQDDAGHYYTQQNGTLYKLHVGAGTSTDLGNGYLVTDATLGGLPTNIIRWFYAKSSVNNTRYVVTMTNDSDGLATVINVDTMTKVGIWRPSFPVSPAVTGFSNGNSVGAYMDTSGVLILWFSDPTTQGVLGSIPNVCTVNWNPSNGVSVGVLNVTKPEPEYQFNLSLNTNQFGINWVAFLPSLDYIVVSNNMDFTSGIGVINQNPLPAVTVTFLSPFLGPDARSLYCGTFDAPSSAYDVGTQNGSVIALPGDIDGSTAQVGGTINLLNPANLNLINTYNVTSIINNSSVPNKVPADVTTGRGNQSITSVSGDGATATYVCNNSFTVGQRVTTLNCTPSSFNISNLVITAASPTSFQVSLPVTQSATAQSGAFASVTFAPIANMRYSAAKNAVLVTYEYVGSPAYWVLLTAPNPIIGGAFQDLEGNPLANGYVLCKLTEDAQITGVGQLGAGAIMRIPLDASGNATGVVGLWPNDALLPNDSQYVMTAYSAAGQPVWEGIKTVTSSPNPFPLT